MDSSLMLMFQLEQIDFLGRYLVKGYPKGEFPFRAPDKAFLLTPPNNSFSCRLHEVRLMRFF
jgi:hypothetical protein